MRSTHAGHGDTSSLLVSLALSCPKQRHRPGSPNCSRVQESPHPSIYPTPSYRHAWRMEYCGSSVDATWRIRPGSRMSMNTILPSLRSANSSLRSRKGIVSRSGMRCCPPLAQEDILACGRALSSAAAHNNPVGNPVNARRVRKILLENEVFKFANVLVGRLLMERSAK